MTWKLTMVGGPGDVLDVSVPEAPGRGVLVWRRADGGLEFSEVAVPLAGALRAPRRLYRCPVCLVYGSDTYLRCDHPMCPDGRDR